MGDVGGGRRRGGGGVPLVPHVSSSLICTSAALMLTKEPVRSYLFRGDGGGKKYRHGSRCFVKPVLLVLVRPREHTPFCPPPPQPPPLYSSILSILPAPPPTHTHTPQPRPPSSSPPSLPLAVLYHCPILVF